MSILITVALDRVQNWAGETHEGRSVELYRRLPYPTTVRVAVPDSASAHASMRSCSPCDPCHGGSRRSVAAEDRPV
jgi:hypothetical protein